MKASGNSRSIFVTTSIFLLLGADWALASQSRPAVPKTPIVEAIQGSKTVNLVKGKKKRDGFEGTQIQYGEKIKTSDGISATLLYPDGSRVFVSKNTEFVIEDYVEETQWNRLKEGTIRGIVSKPKIATSAKPRFLVRTKAAVLGVRGTDFVMEMNLANETAQVHTLEGSVEVAQNELSLLSGKGTQIGEGQFIEGGRAGLSSPQSFDKQEFLKAFEGLGNSTGSTLGASSGIASSGDAMGSPSSAVQGAPLQRPSTPAAEPQNSPPTMVEPTRFKPPEVAGAPVSPPEDKKEDKSDSDSVSRSIKLVSFQLGFFYTQLSDGTIIRAANAVWTPRFPIPYVPFLELRGSLGASFARDASFSDNFFVPEAQVFLTLSLFNLIFAEVGFGQQAWRSLQSYESQLLTVDAGFHFSLGPIDRVFVGIQNLMIDPQLTQVKIGFALTLF